jgi:WXG100 family type VII secretion target
MADSGTILYQYGALQNLAGVLRKVSGQIQQDKQMLESETAPARTGDAWQGAAKEAWAALQTSYDQLTQHLGQVVQSFGGGVDSAQQLACETDTRLAGLF